MIVMGKELKKWSQAQWHMPVIPVRRQEDHSEFYTSLDFKMRDFDSKNEKRMKKERKEEKERGEEGRREGKQRKGREGKNIVKT